MANIYDIAYWTGIGAASPFWLIKPSARKKVLGALEQRMGKLPMRPGNNPAVLIHAVSLGEVNATQSLIKMLHHARPDLDLILSTTTETGYMQAMRLYPHGSGVWVVRYPLDFSGAVNQLLNQLRPSLVVLMELELWPNFMKRCEDRNIPVIVVNGRLTTSSYRKYRAAGVVTKRMFRRLTTACVQDELYAERFKKLGVKDVQVTGTMKFDTAQLQDRVSGSSDLAHQVGLRPGTERIWVCGSTGPGEEELILKEYRSLLMKPSFANLRLVLVPRHPDRFDEVAVLIEKNRFPVVRQSSNRSASVDWAIPPVVLGDTLGELKKFYALADVVFVGRSLVNLGSRQHGSDMIEVAALSKPIIVGPYTHNFAEAMRKLRQANAITEVHDARTLGEAILSLFNDRKAAVDQGTRARQVVEREQGATMKHARVILAHLPHALSAG